MIDQTLKRPVIGMLLNDAVIFCLKKQKSIPLHRLDLYAQAASTAGVTLLLFSPATISFNPDKTHGAGYNACLKRWEMGTYPIPDILYDRHAAGSLNEKRKAEFIRHELNRRGVIKLNSRHCFDKLETNKVLSGCEKISPYLPFTSKFDNDRELQKLFDQYPTLYFKAADGRRGKQVLKVTKLRHRGYLYSYFYDRLYSGEAADLLALKKKISLVAGNSKIVVQEAVDLMQVNGRLIDFRGELQRDGKGRLEIVAVPVRVGRKNSPISTHGTSYSFEDFCSADLNISRRSAAALKAEINTFLPAVYHCIEKAYGPFGEIAVDFGVDRDGKLWFFECNARSTKVSLLNCADPVTIRKAFLNPMLYADYLYSARKPHQA